MNILDGVTQSELRELSEALLCGLEPFEVLREPRFVTDAECRCETSLESSGLRDEISCAICCGIIQKCVVIKGCLHRFCADCIEKAMRIGTNECPKCRMHIPSRRSLMPDPIFDSIILRLIPNPKVFEEIRDALLMALNKGLKDDPTIENIRRTFLVNDLNVKLEDISSIKTALGDDMLSVESSFDNKEYMREIKQKRRKIIESLPPAPETLRSCYRLISGEEGIPQVEPNLLFDDGSVTLYHLGMYIKKMIGLPPCREFYFYNKDPWYVAEPTQTLAYIRNMVKRPSHLVLTVYYMTQRPRNDEQS